MKKEILKAKCGCIAEVIKMPFPCLLVIKTCKKYPECNRNKTYEVAKNIGG